MGEHVKCDQEQSYGGTPVDNESVELAWCFH